MISRETTGYLVKRLDISWNDWISRQTTAGFLIELASLCLLAKHRLEMVCSFSLRLFIFAVFLLFCVLCIFLLSVRCLEKKCNYYSSWSKWSATCGNGVKRSKRLRSTSNSYHTVNNLSQCAQYKTSCDGYLYQTKDLNKCPGWILYFFV